MLTYNVGRIDLVVQMPQTTIVFELKVDKTAAIALDQAQEKKYSTQYAQDGKEILVVGINFSSESRDIADWQGELFTAAGEHIRSLKPDDGPHLPKI